MEDLETIFDLEVFFCCAREMVVESDAVVVWAMVSIISERVLIKYVYEAYLSNFQSYLFPGKRYLLHIRVKPPHF